MIIAQLTDLHIKREGQLAYRKVDTSAALEAALDHLAALPMRPDLVLFTGDLVDTGHPEEYARLVRHLSKLTQPFYLLPGNHDAREALRAAFPGHGYLGMEGPACYTVEAYKLRIIALDSLVPGQGGGALGAGQLDWLAQRLEEQPERPTLIALHHPPFATGIGHMDKLGLADAESFAAIVSRHKQVLRVICGHVHRPITTGWAGSIASIAPSIAHQVALDLREDAPSAFMMEPGGYQLHAFSEAGGLVSHTALTGGWAGPFPFFDAEGRLIE